MRKVTAMRLRTAILLTAVTVLASCSSRNTTLPVTTSATPSTSPRSTSSVAVAPTSELTRSTSAEPATTTASPTTTTTAIPPATEQPTTVPTTMPTETTPSVLSDSARGEVALFVAQSLATAFAHGDWTAARTISPQSPEWSDAKYAKGFAGLDEAFVTPSNSLILGPTGGHAGSVEMWLVEVAHETRAAAHRTSVYCIHWTFVEESQAIVRVAGIKVASNAGTLDPSAQTADALPACNHFDEYSAVPDTIQPAAPAPVTTVGCPRGGLDVQVVSFTSTQPFLEFGGSGWVVRVHLLVTNRSTAAIQLNGPPPQITSSGALPVFGSIDAWTEHVVLPPGKSVRALASTVSGGPPTDVYLTSLGGWLWPEYTNC